MMTNDDIFTQLKDKNGLLPREFSDPIKKGLQYPLLSIYGYRASAKSGAGIGVPECLSAIHDAPSVFFCVVGIAHPFFGRAVIIRAARKIMVGCSGAEKSAPVSDNAGYANPVQPITSEIGVSGDGIYPQLSEAAPMATTPTQKPSFIWRFYSCQQSRYLTVFAPTEPEARALLPDSPCLFSARIRTGGAHA